MPKFAANLAMLFCEHDFLDRFRAAAEAGFRAVEYPFPYAFAPDDLRDALKSNGLVQVLHNLPAGDWAVGERGIACHPDRVDEFRDGVDQAIAYARVLDCPQVNVLAGVVPADVDPCRTRETLVANLRFAADRLRAEGIRLLAEPINTRDVPGFYLSRTADALDLFDEVGSDNLALQYDIYHMQIMEGDLATTIQRHLGRIGHLQLADNPGRHEPGTGEINYPFLFGLLDQLDYAGWIGCEYHPADDTRTGLQWITPYR